MRKYKSMLASVLLVFAFATQAFPDEPTAVTADNARLERDKFEFQKTLEMEKLRLERSTAWMTGSSIAIPLVLGVITLLWQSRAAMKLKERDSKDAFDLKVAEIAFSSETARGAKSRAMALADLFPNRLSATFGKSFDPKKFDVPRYEAKVEVFRAAVSRASSPKEICMIWYQLFPTDRWLEPLLFSKPPVGPIDASVGPIDDSDAFPPDH